MSTDKYELVPAIGRAKYRIRALRSFSDVKEGDLGGFVDSEHCLSHDGDCWVYDEALVSDGANVIEDAKIFDMASVREGWISGSARISGSSYVLESHVVGRAEIFGSASLCGAVVSENAKVSGFARVHGTVTDNARVSGCAYIGEDTSINDESVIEGDAYVDGGCYVAGSARISSKEDYLFALAFGLGVAAYRVEGREVYVSAGCQCFPVSTPAHEMRHLAEDNLWPVEIVDVVRPMILRYFGMEDNG